MYSLLAKKGQLFAIILGVGVVLIYFATVIGGIGSAGYDMSTDLNQVLKNNTDQSFGFFDIGLKLTIGLVVIAALIAVVFGLIHMLGAPKNSLKAIIGIAVIAAVFFGLYSIADADTTSAISKTLQKFDVSDNVSKLISGGILTTGILAGASVVAMILGEIYNLFK